MLRSTVFAIATFLTAATNAAPAATSPPYEITKMKIGKVEGGNVTFSFTVHNPDPLTLATSPCAGEWVSGSRQFPQDTYELCGHNSTFGWNMEELTTIKKFTMNIEHTYEDPAVGQPPYDWITNFGRVSINSANFPCTVDGDVTTCKQSAKVIQAPIYATIAKKR